ncbi:NADH-ubiquinone oxidoreductase subunit E family protein [Campylobacter sp. MG1]|uniref:NADH-ubiquinone oxidoreductase subunit E family protein n=1 Tax=Campylobacter sp. MG1 TaxID=2976332 RepID=UPI00226D2F78|nr:NADH-ubiquinone oxidoreductase subunit E family protein [Campylobacter sp. MG1]
MKRIDLRKSKDLFADLKTHIDDAKIGEVLVILFEIGDFSNVEKSYKFVYDNECKLLNSLKFNQSDWTIVIKKDTL